MIPELVAKVHFFYSFEHSGFYVTGTTAASSMMDKQGRRSLLMGSYAGMVRPLVVTINVIGLSDLLV